MARVLYAAGFRHGDLIHNCFSYVFTPGAFIFEGGARKLGCAVFPGGTGQVELQLQAIADMRADGLRRQALVSAHHDGEGPRKSGWMSRP